MAVSYRYFHTDCPSIRRPSVRPTTLKSSEHPCQPGLRGWPSRSLMIPVLFHLYLKFQHNSVRWFGGRARSLAVGKPDLDQERSLLWLIIIPKETFQDSSMKTCCPPRSPKIWTKTNNKYKLQSPSSFQWIKHDSIKNMVFILN